MADIELQTVAVTVPTSTPLVFKMVANGKVYTDVLKLTSPMEVHLKAGTKVNLGGYIYVLVKTPVTTTDDLTKIIDEAKLHNDWTFDIPKGTVVVSSMCPHVTLDEKTNVSFNASDATVELPYGTILQHPTYLSRIVLGDVATATLCI